MPKGYNSLNGYRINPLEIGICPVCCRRLTSECQHRTDESEQWYAALIVAETNTDITPCEADRLHAALVTAENNPQHNLTDPRAPAEIVDDVYAAEVEATRASDYPI